MIKAVLFDNDGTLLNTNDLIFDSYKVAFKTVLNREIGYDEIMKLYGRPLYSSLMEYGEKGEELYHTYRHYNELLHDDVAKPFKGAAEGVKMLKKAGFTVGMVSSKRRELLDKGIKIMGLENTLDIIVTPEDTKRFKPDPEPLLYAADKLGFSARECMYVGDSEFDFRAARAAGMELCAVSYSLTPAEKIAEFKPDYTVDSIVELAEQLKSRVANL